MFKTILSAKAAMDYITQSKIVSPKEPLILPPFFSLLNQL